MATEGSKPVHILLAEDETTLRLFLENLLGIWGFNVLSASDGKQALELATCHEGHIDLLISNVVMPELTGPELATEVTAIRPTTKVMLISGYPQDAFVLTAGWKFLAKPFLPKRLFEEIQQLLCSGSVGNGEGVPPLS